jgi:hypothetical protein
MQKKVSTHHFKNRITAQIMLLICIHRVSLPKKKGLNMQSTCCIATLKKLPFLPKSSSSCTTLHDNFIAASFCFVLLVIFICDYVLPCHDETINLTIKHSLMLPFFTSTSLSFHIQKNIFTEKLSFIVVI